MPFMTRIPSDLARFGLTVELVPGWETRGSSSFAPGGVTCHWTAGPKNAALTSRPSLNICVNGRTGIPGPLCNIYLARDGTCVVVAAGRANHAGVGGFRGLVGNSAVYGIEAECAGDGDWSKDQLRAYPRLVAGLLSGLDRDASWAHGHHEWAPTRKIDIRDVMPTIRTITAAVLNDPDQNQEGFLMALTDAEQREILDRLRGDTSRGYDMLQSIEALAKDVAYRVRGTHEAMDSFQVLQWQLSQLTAKAPADVDEDKLAAALAGAIPDSLAQSVVDKLAARLAA